MKWIALGAALALLIMSGSALALEIKNRDDKQHVVTVTEGTSVVELTLGPGDYLADLCKTSCQVYLTGDTGYMEASWDEQLMIQDGELMVDDIQQ